MTTTENNAADLETEVGTEIQVGSEALLAALVAEQEAAGSDEEAEAPTVNHVIVPAELMLAASKCMAAANDKTRSYLAGIHLRVKDRAENLARIEATDGHVLFAANFRTAEPLPAWLGEGVILEGAEIVDIVRICNKMNGNGLIRVERPQDNPFIQIGDGFRCRFQISPIDAAYPQIDQLVGDIDLTEGGDPLDGVSMNPALIKKAVAIAGDLHEDKADAITSYSRPLKPTVICFAYPGAFMIMMPMKTSETAALNNPLTRLALDPAVKRTLAALKAHRTRQENALPELSGASREAAVEKIADLDSRINALLGVTALPAPAAEVDHGPDLEEQSDPEGEEPDGDDWPEGDEPEAEAEGDEVNESDFDPAAAIAEFAFGENSVDGKPEADPEAAGEEPEADGVDLESLSVRDLRAHLESLGVELPAKASRKILLGLIPAEAKEEASEMVH